MRNRPFPEILRRRFLNWRYFKKLKRQEIRHMIRESEDMICASAFLPPEAYNLTCRIREDLHKVTELLSEKEWGR